MPKTLDEFINEANHLADTDPDTGRAFVMQHAAAFKEDGEDKIILLGDPHGRLRVLRRNPGETEEECVKRFIAERGEFLRAQIRKDGESTRDATAMPDANEIERFLEQVIAEAKRLREGCGYSGDEEFPHIAFVRTRDEKLILPIDSTRQEKQAVMRMLWQIAKEKNALFVAVVVDTRELNLNEFADYFHLTPPSDGNWDKWDKEAKREACEIIGYYGGMKYLPRPLWSDAVKILIKGPAVKPLLRSLPYEKGDGDTLRWLSEETEENLDFQSNFLPDWWEEASV
jgi:hypothetical protein